MTQEMATTQEEVKSFNLTLDPVNLDLKNRVSLGSAAQLVKGLKQRSDTLEATNDFQKVLYPGLKSLSDLVVQKFTEQLLTCKDQTEQDVRSFFVVGYSGKLTTTVRVKRVRQGLTYEYVRHGDILKHLRQRMTYIETKPVPTIYETEEKVEAFKKLQADAHAFGEFLDNDASKLLKDVTTDARENGGDVVKANLQKRLETAQQYRTQRNNAATEGEGGEQSTERATGTYEHRTTRVRVVRSATTDNAVDETVDAPTYGRGPSGRAYVPRQTQGERNYAPRGDRTYAPRAPRAPRVEGEGGERTYAPRAPRVFHQRVEGEGGERTYAPRVEGEGGGGERTYAPRRYNSDRPETDGRQQSYGRGGGARRMNYTSGRQYNSQQN
jgi:hypothetical protein